MSLLPNQLASRMLRLRMPKVCVSLNAVEAADLFYRADLQVRENTFLEFRLDYLKNPISAIPGLKRFFEYRPDAIGIATCRREAHGGKFRGSLAAEIEVLSTAAAAGCHIIDLEVESAESMKAADLKRLRAGASLLLSHHNYHSTRQLENVLERMKVFAPDFYKVVGTATSLHDNVLMLSFLQKHCDDYSLVGICMGEPGLLSRVLSVRAGGMFTFASPAVGEKTAAGQVSARELQELYRVDQLDAATRVYGVVGNPVRHSLSPAIMNAAMRRESVNAVYLPLLAKTIEDVMACLREIPIHGVSVTMPYKEEITRFLDNTDQLTAQTGSCNTVVRGQDARFIGFNTDIAGILAPLSAQVNLTGQRALVIGAGGAARAAIYALKQRGAEVHILNRTPANAHKLARKFGAKTVKRSDLGKLEFAVAINATPVGMGASHESPLNEKELKSVRCVFDLVYNPLETRLIQLARAQGIPVISGVEMFVHQAARQFEIWTGKPAPVEQMRQVVLRQLGMRSAAAAALEARDNGDSEPEPAPAADAKDTPPVTAVVSAKAVQTKAVPTKAVAAKAVPERTRTPLSVSAKKAPTHKPAPPKAARKSSNHGKPEKQARPAAARKSSRK